MYVGTIFDVFAASRLSQSYHFFGFDKHTVDDVGETMNDFSAIQRTVSSSTFISM